MWKVIHLNYSITVHRYTTIFPSQLQARRIKSPNIRFASLITMHVLTNLQNWAGPGTTWPAGPVSGRAGCLARADEAVLATLQRNVGSLRLRLDVCCERPQGSRDRAVWSHKGAWKRMNALQFQLSLDSFMSTVNVEWQRQQNRMQTHSQTGTCTNLYANFSTRRNGAAMKMTSKLSLQSNLSHQSVVSSPCVEQISKHPCTGTR